VDKVTDLDSVVPEAVDELTRLSKIPQPAFAITKNSFRGEKVERLRKVREADIDNFVGLLRRPNVQGALGMYLEQLKGRKK